MATAIQASVTAYERWLKQQLGPELVQADLRRKHEKMVSAPFPFLRATYWRWAETILDALPDLADVPPVLAIGDAHVENFGCWRDAEGRLVWGANDFDDAAVMPYALDLVRLAASALLARAGKDPGSREICQALLDGYEAGLDRPGPKTLELDHQWLRQMVLLPEEGRTDFWSKFEGVDEGAAVGGRYRDALRAALPESASDFAAFARTAGVGSLGRPRFVAKAAWRGGPVLREVKVVLTSAWVLHHGGDPAIRIDDIAAGRFRALDPHYRVADGLVVRRLSPSSRKIEAKDSVGDLLSPKMLKAMGREVANCHAGDVARFPALLADRPRRTVDWLRDRAKVAADLTAKDQADYAQG